MKRVNTSYMTNGFAVLLALLALCTVGGCDSEDDLDLWEKDARAVRIFSLIGEKKSNARVTDSEIGSAWDSGDRITVRETVSNLSVDYGYNGSSWIPSDSNSYLRWEENGESSSFFSWHPADNTIDGYTTFTLPIDQSKGLTSADWMTAQTTLPKPADNAISLMFERKMSKVTLVVESWNEQFSAGNEIADFVIQSASSKFTENEPDNMPKEVTPQNDNGKTKLPELDNNRKPLNKEDCPRYTAIVFPTAAQSTEKLMKCKVNGYDLTLTGIPLLEAGVHYTFSLTMGKAAVTVSHVKVNDWTTGKNISGDAPEQF